MAEAEHDKSRKEKNKKCEWDRKRKWNERKIIERQKLWAYIRILSHINSLNLLMIDWLYMHRNPCMKNNRKVKPKCRIIDLHSYCKSYQSMHRSRRWTMNCLQSTFSDIEPFHRISASSQSTQVYFRLNRKSRKLRSMSF